MHIKLFSDDFYAKLELFDAGRVQVSFLEQSEASRGLDSFNNFLNESHGGDSMRKTRMQVRGYLHLQLPAIQKSSPKGKSPMLRTHSNFGRSANDSERVMGLKFFLGKQFLEEGVCDNNYSQGHLNNVEDPRANLVISKSSINLNKLQDVRRELWCSV
jgi:hypothetical protein